jgi:hypothetical protein
MSSLALACAAPLAFGLLRDHRPVAATAEQPATTALEHVQTAIDPPPMPSPSVRARESAAMTSANAEHTVAHAVAASTVAQPVAASTAAQPGAHFPQPVAAAPIAANHVVAAPVAAKSAAASADSKPAAVGAKPAEVAAKLVATAPITAKPAALIVTKPAFVVANTAPDVANRAGIAVARSVIATAASVAAPKPPRDAAPAPVSSEAALLRQYQRVGHDLIELERKLGPTSVAELRAAFRDLHINDIMQSASSQQDATLALADLERRIVRMQPIEITDDCKNNPLANTCH